MIQCRLSKLELRIMRAFWRGGALSVRNVQEQLIGKKRPAYTTVQTVMNRLEAKGAIRRVAKTGKAYVFEARVSQSAAIRNLVDEFLTLFGGRVQPLVAHLVERGKLSAKNIEEAESRCARK
jgi:predicted transcriptional regulator